MVAKTGFFGLAWEPDRKKTVAILLSLLKANNWHLTTGFLGTPYLCHALSHNGQQEVAYLADRFSVMAVSDYKRCNDSLGTLGRNQNGRLVLEPRYELL